MSPVRIRTLLGTDLNAVLSIWNRALKRDPITMGRFVSSVLGDPDYWPGEDSARFGNHFGLVLLNLRAEFREGEILQLPQTDEVVLLSGAPPIKAKKARYYADRRLQARVANAPASCGQRHGGAAPDDWSTLPPIEPDPDLAKEHRRKLDSANGGLRREPELPEHVEVVAKAKAPAAEFEFADILVEGAEDGLVDRRRRAFAHQRHAPPVGNRISQLDRRYLRQGNRSRRSNRLAH